MKNWDRQKVDLTKEEMKYRKWVLITNKKYDKHSFNTLHWSLSVTNKDIWFNSQEGRGVKKVNSSLGGIQMKIILTHY